MHTSLPRRTRSRLTPERTPRPRAGAGRAVYETLRRVGLLGGGASSLPPWDALPSWHRHLLEASALGVAYPADAPAAAGASARARAEEVVDAWLAEPFEGRDEAAADLVAAVASELAWRDGLIVALMNGERCREA